MTPIGTQDALAFAALSRHQWAQRTEDGFQKSITLARTAIERDPKSGQAHGMLALAHVTRASYAHAPAAADLEPALDSARVALELDPTILEAHLALAFLRLFVERDFAGARAEFEEALRLKPDDPTTHQWYSLWFLANDRDDEACALASRAEELGPGSPIYAAHSAWMLYHAGRFEQALSKANGVVQAFPNFWRGYFNLALTQAAAERADEAVNTVEAAIALNSHTALTAIQVHALALAGHSTRAEATWLELESSGQFVSPYWQAYALIGLGRHQAAVDQLTASVAAREWFALFLKHEPAFAQLRTLPSFDNMRRTIGLA